MTVSNELKEIADDLSTYTEDITQGLDNLFNTAESLNKSFSGSWLGYHSRVYYSDFKTPPAGAVFTSEWGLMQTVSTLGSYGDWKEYAYDDVIKYIMRKAKEPNVGTYHIDSDKVAAQFEESKSQALSIIHSNLKDWGNDKFLEGLLKDIDELVILTEAEFVNIHSPKGQIISRDSHALHNGIQTPPHIVVMCRVMSIKAPYYASEKLCKLLKRLSKHVGNIRAQSIVEERMGVNIFIGHGRSPLWRELKDFITDKLHLPHDEFNRTPVAGFTNIARLSQMLEQARFAFLLMTAEDENSEGKLQARMNVIHEVGLFQGRLGFEKAIIILEEGCEEFSNVQGLGQIRFPKGNISAVFHEIREVLERENLIRSN